MKRILIIYICLAFAFMPTLGMASTEYELTLNGDLIAKELDKVEMAVAKEPPVQPVVAVQPSVPLAKPEESDAAQTAADVKNQYANNQSEYYIQDETPRKHSFQVGYEKYDYTYQETVGGRDFMSNKGDYNGYSFDYAYRVDDDTMIVDEFRLQTRFATGDVVYRADAFEYDSLEDYMFEVRGLAAKNIQLNKQVKLVPYFGLGIRYLNNGLEAIPARMDGADEYLSGYNRESQYVYLPVGGDLKLDLPAGWHVALNLEYDHLLRGRQQSHLEDSRALDGTDYGYENLVNSQNKGYGARASLKLAKNITKNFNIYVEPFVRYWSIEDSDIQWVQQNGSLICEGNVCAAGQEPSNTTKEVGVKIGVGF